VILVFQDLLAHTWNILQRIKYWEKVGEGLACPVVCIYDYTEISKVFLESDRERLCLDEGGLSEEVISEVLEDF